MEVAVENEAGERKPWRIYGWLVLGLFLVFAYCYVWAVQPGYGPDEPRHFLFVQRMVEKGKLPLLVNGVEEDGAHTLHPPLYYVLVSPVYMVSRGLGMHGSNRVIKHFSPLILLSSLLLFGSMLRRLFPGRPFVVAAALTLVALLPEFQLEASVMNNDSLAIFMGALFLWLLVVDWDKPPSARAALWAGFAMAAFVNTKPTGWSLAPLWALSLGIRAWRTGGRPRDWIRDLAIGYGILLLLGTWWYVRNHQLYGEAVPVPLDWNNGATRPRHSRTGEILTPMDVYTTGEVIPLGWRAVEGLFVSFWTQIDWVPEPLRPAVFGTLLVLTLLGGAGWVKRLARGLKEGGPPRKVDLLPRLKVALTPLALMVTGFLILWLTTWYVATFLHLGFYQGGRYLMPFAFAAGAVLAAGWDELLPRRFQLPAAGLLCLGLVAFNILCLVELVTVLNPRYVQP